MSDTPETQKAVLESNGQWSFVLKECCERLERERDEARESNVLNFKLRKELDDAKSKIKSQADRIRYLEGATNHAKGTPLSVALRERDEARESLKHISEYGTDEINAAVELRQKLATALVERDEAREELCDIRLNLGEDAEGYTLTHAVCVLQNERNEAMEDSLEQARLLGMGSEREAKLISERDEAREDLEHWKIEYEIVVSRLCGIKHERDNGIIAEHEIIPVLKETNLRQAERIRYLEGATNHACGTPLSVALRERDKARAALMKIEDLFIDGTDIYADRENMGLIAREALEGTK